MCTKMYAHRSHPCSLEVKPAPTTLRPGSFTHPTVNTCQRSTRKHVKPGMLESTSLLYRIWVAFAAYKPESFYGYPKPAVLQSRNYSCRIPYLGRKVRHPSLQIMCWCIRHADKKELIHTLICFRISTCAVGKMICTLPNLSRCCKIFEYEMYTGCSGGKKGLGSI